MQEKGRIEFWGAGTMRTFRPLWVAEELGLEYILHGIGPRTGETQTPHYTGLNPKQKVPFMTDGSFGLSESVAISRYLIERYGTDDTMVLPSTIESRAREDEWVSYVYGELDETALYVMRRHGDLSGIYGDAPAAVAAAKAYAEKHLNVVAQFVDGKEFLLGDRLGLGDVMLVSCLDWAVHYGFELTESLLAYQGVHHARDAYRRAYDANYSK
jgi:glutathione S-transferase